MKPLFKNLQLKILALLSAIVLWFFVVGIENNSYRFPEEVDVHAANLTQELSLASDLGKARLRIRAGDDQIKNLTKGDFDVYVDLRNAKEGEADVPLIANSKNDKVSILKVEPATVHVILETVTQKEVKIKTVVTGNPAKGYTAKEVVVSPDIATISGGKTLLGKITSVTAEIKLSGTESTNFKQNIALKFNDNDNTNKNIVIAPEQVTADVMIALELQQKNLVIKPDLRGSVDLVVLSKKLETNPPTVIVQGKEDDLNALSFISTDPVNLDLLKSGEHVKTKLILPKGVTLLDSEANTVTIYLTAPQ